MSVIPNPAGVETARVGSGCGKACAIGGPSGGRVAARATRSKNVAASQRRHVGLTRSFERAALRTRCPGLPNRDGHAPDRAACPWQHRSRHHRARAEICGLLRHRQRGALFGRAGERDQRGDGRGRPLHDPPQRSAGRCEPPLWPFEGRVLFGRARRRADRRCGVADPARILQRDLCAPPDRGAGHRACDQRGCQRHQRSRSLPTASTS
jgi:hypothetical protein